MDDEHDLEVLSELNKSQRTALYNYLTARAYRLNKDALRESALWVRDDLMKTTRSEDNIIPFDRVPKKPKQSDFLPPIYNDSVSE